MTRSVETKLLLYGVYGVFLYILLLRKNLFFPHFEKIKMKNLCSLFCRHFLICAQWLLILFPPSVSLCSCVGLVSDWPLMLSCDVLSVSAQHVRDHAAAPSRLRQQGSCRSFYFQTFLLYTFLYDKYRGVCISSCCCRCRKWPLKGNGSPRILC